MVQNWHKLMAFGDVKLKNLNVKYFSFVLKRYFLLGVFMTRRKRKKMKKRLKIKRKMITRVDIAARRGRSAFIVSFISRFIGLL